MRGHDVIQITKGWKKHLLKYGKLDIKEKLNKKKRWFRKMLIYLYNDINSQQKGATNVQREPPLPPQQEVPRQQHWTEQYNSTITIEQLQRHWTENYNRAIPTGFLDWAGYYNKTLTLPDLQQRWQQSTMEQRSTPPSTQLRPIQYWYRSLFSTPEIQRQQSQPPLPPPPEWQPPPPPPRIPEGLQQRALMETYNTSMLIICSSTLFKSKGEKRGLAFGMENILKKSKKRTITATSVDNYRCQVCDEGSFSKEQLDTHTSSKSGQKDCQQILKVRKEIIKELGNYFQDNTLLISQTLYYNGIQQSSKEQIKLITAEEAVVRENAKKRQITKVVDDKCGVCKKGHSNPPNEIIYCDGEGCKYAVHQHCIAPVPLLIIPEEEWYCQICLPSFNTMMDVTDNNNNDSNNNSSSSSSSSSSNNISNNNNSNNNNISNCNNDNSNSTGQTSTPTNRTTGAKTQNSNSTSRKGGNNNNNTRINTTNNNNYHNSKQKTTEETPQNTQSTGKSPVGESSVGESSVGELTAAEKIIQKEPAKSHSVLTTTNNKEFDKPDGTVCPPLRRSKRLQENLNKDTDSDISA